MMKIAKIIALITTIICIGYAVCVGVAHWQIYDLPELLSDSDKLLGFIGAYMAIANAILLYATLSYQGRSFKQERFETTLFNLLDNHRKLVSSIHFNVETWDWTFSKQMSTIDESTLFSFALKEIHYLKKIIQCETFPQMTNWEFQENIAYVENQRDGVNDELSINELNNDRDGVIDSYELARRTTIYKIDINKWNVSKNRIVAENCRVEKVAYALFFQKWRKYYTPYFKSLTLIFKHISDENIGKVEKAKYKDYVTNQMTQDELDVIKLHRLYDDSFCKLIKQISMSKKWYIRFCECTKRKLCSNRK